MNTKKGHKLYDKDNNLLNILGCVDCDICKAWQNQPWRVRVYSPVHCYCCHYAGYDDEYTVYYPEKHAVNINNLGLFLCLDCDKKIKLLKNPKNLRLRELGIKI